MFIFLIGFGFALYHASGFTYSCVIIKSLIWLDICNIAAYIKYKVTVKAGGLYTVAG